MRSITTALLLLAIALPSLAEEPPAKKGDDAGPDTRTKMELSVGRLSQKNAEKVIEKLEATSAIAKAEVDVDGKKVTVTFEGGAACSLMALKKAAAAGGITIDTRKLELPKHFTVHVAAEFRDWQFDRSKYKRKGKARFQQEKSQRLLAALKATDGIKSAKFETGKAVKCGGDRNVSYSHIVKLFTEYGKQGSDKIVDIKWEGEAQIERRANKKRKK